MLSKHCYMRLDAEVAEGMVRKRKVALVYPCMLKSMEKTARGDPGPSKRAGGTGSCRII